MRKWGHRRVPRARFPARLRHAGWESATYGLEVRCLTVGEAMFVLYRYSILNFITITENNY